MQNTDKLTLSNNLLYVSKPRKQVVIERWATSPLILILTNYNHELDWSWHRGRWDVRLSAQGNGSTHAVKTALWISLEETKELCGIVTKKRSEQVAADVGILIIHAVFPNIGIVT